MAHKKFELNEKHSVTIYKRRSSRNLRLSISPDGEIRVSIPVWAPYKVGLEFAKKRQAWINEQHRTLPLLVNGQAIGKSHHLKFVPVETDQVRARLKQNEIIVSYPLGMSDDNEEVQDVARKACIRALKKQAHLLLPKRLSELAARNNFKYNSVVIKRLKSRWGSCDQHQNIVLNLYLIQLPWEYIDYVLLHELTHTKVLRHGPPFWEAMEQVLPDAKQKRRAMLAYQPVLDSSLL